MTAIILTEAILREAGILAEIHANSRRKAMPFLPELHTFEETREWISAHLFVVEKVWVARVDATPVGFVSVHDGWLNNLYVDPGYQGMGVGSRLFDWAREEMPDGFQFWVFQENHRARAFYEARGCRLVKLTDGADNEEKTPDALYEWKPDR